MRVALFRIAVAALAGAACAQLASAQGFPSKPMHIIVPFSAGGVVDAMARVFGQQITESTGHPVVVEDRPGASSIIGMQACAKSPPDGHTVCITVADSLSYNPNLFTNLPYDADADFAAVTNLAWSNNLIVANVKAPAATFKEMIAYAKARPGALNWGTWGAASLPDMYLKWVRHLTGVNITAVPYKGAGQANPAFYAGEVDLTYMGIGNAMPQIKAGKIRALVVIGPKRNDMLPDVPSLAEEGGDPGLRGYFGLFAPGRTPKAMVDQVNAEFLRAMRTPALQKFYAFYTLDPVGNSAAEFTEFMKSDRANAGKAFRIMGIQPSAAPN